MSKTVTVRWRSAAKMTDADGNPLRRGDTGPLDHDRAHALQRQAFCTVLEGDVINEPDESPAIMTADEYEEESDGTDDVQRDE